MRMAILIGALAALLLGAAAIAVALSSIGSEPPMTPPAPTPTPGGSSLGLYTPPPTHPPTPTPTPTMPGSPSVPVGTQVGNLAPRLVLPTLIGGEIDTARAAGTPLWVNFMATWCPSCRDELPMMQRIGQQLEDDVEIVLVDVGEPEAIVSDFMIDLGVDLPVALDTDSAAQRAWGAFALPVHFLIDADGVVREVIYGGAPREIFLEALPLIVPDAEIDLEPTSAPDAPEPSEEASPSP